MDQEHLHPTNTEQSREASSQGGENNDVRASRVTQCNDLQLLSVGGVFLLFSTAYWTNQAIVNRYTYLHILDQLQQQSDNFSSNTFTDVILPPGIRCQANLTTDDRHILNEAQVRTTRLLLLFSVATEIPAFFSLGVLGVYSDTMGRRTLFAFAAVGQFVMNLTTTVSIVMGWNPRLLFVGSVVFGLAGGFGVVRLACYTYAVDLARAGIQRTVALAFLQALIGAGGVVVHVLIGFGLENFELRYPSYFSLLPPVIVCLIGCLRLLRETVEVQSEVLEGEDVEYSCGILGKLAGFLRHVVHKLSHFYFRRFPRENMRSRFLLGLLCFCFLSYPSKARFRLLFMYEVNSPLCWAPSIMGLYRAFSEGCRHFLGYVFIRILRLCACCDDELLGMVGILSHAASDVLTGILGTSTEGMFEAAVAGVGGAMPVPIIRSLMSQLASPDRQGSLFATLAMVESAVGTLGQWGLFSQYEDTVGIMRGTTVFFTMAALSTAAFFTLWAFRRRSRGRHCDTVLVITIGDPEESPSPQQPSVQYCGEDPNTLGIARTDTVIVVQQAEEQGDKSECVENSTCQSHGCLS